MSTYDICETCGGYQGVLFVTGTAEGDLKRMGLLRRCQCPEYNRPVDMRTPIEKRLDAVIALLEEIRDQGKAKSEKKSSIGPFMVGVPE